MYLHQQRLAEAIKRLYMLGNRPYRGGSDSSEGLGGVLSTGIEQAVDSNKRTQAKAAAYDSKVAQANKVRGEFDRMRQAQDLRDQFAYMSRQNELAGFKDQVNRMKASDAGIEAPVNGEFSPSGEQANRQGVDAVNNDINVTKSLMQHGVNLEQPHAQYVYPGNQGMGGTSARARIS